MGTHFKTSKRRVDNSKTEIVIHCRKVHNNNVLQVDKAFNLLLVSGHRAGNRFYISGTWFVCVCVCVCLCLCGVCVCVSVQSMI